MSATQLIESLVPDQPLLTREEVADLARMKIESLAVMASRRTGPAFIKLGRAVRYPRPAVVAWLAGRAVTTTP